MQIFINKKVFVLRHKNTDEFYFKHFHQHNNQHLKKLFISLTNQDRTYYLTVYSRLFAVNICYIT